MDAPRHEYGHYMLEVEPSQFRAGHGVVGHFPKGAIAISEEEARALAASYRTDPPPRPAADPSITVAVLAEVNDTIAAVVNEASKDRDAEIAELRERVRRLDMIIDAIGSSARKVEEGKT